MKKQEHAGIRISVRQAVTTTKEKRLRLASVLVLQVCFAAGLFGVIAETASLQPGARFCISMAVFAAACGTGLLLNEKGKGLLTAAAVPVIAGICLVFSDRLRGCAAPILNGILSRQQQVQGRIHLPYASNGDVIWAAIAAAALLGFLTAALYPRVSQAAVLPLIAAWILTAAGYTSVSIWTVLMELSCVALLTAALRRRYFGKKPFALLQAAVICLVLLTAVGAAVSASDAAQRLSTDDIRHEAEKAVHRLRYGEAVFPEGDFSGLAGKPKTEKPLLRVTLSESAALWLRGFVGQNYSEHGWRNTSGAALSEDGELFYWLHRSGFFGQSQLETVAKLLGEALTEQTAEIEILSSCRRNLPIPYGITSENDILRPEQIGDEAASAAGIAGAKAYSCRFVPGLEAQAYELLAKLDEHLQDPALQEYLRQESYYRSFVYRNYLEMPEETRRTIREFLGEAPQHITSYEAKETICTALKQAAEYDETLGLAAGDPVTVFLKGQGGGWSVQYATAAVMMLRYYGIPARYVEGYLIPQKKAAQTVTLTGADAHAWAEYYEDGLGWIPFEVTPPFLGLMPESTWQWFERDENARLKSASSEDGMLSGSQMQSSRSTVTQTEQETQTQQQAQQHHSSRRPEAKKHCLLWLPVIVLILLVGAILWIVLRRRKILEKRRLRMENADAAVAIGAMFAHSMQMMWHSGLKKENGALAADSQSAADWLDGEGDFAQMLALNDEALFSSHSIDAQQRRSMAQFRGQVLEKYRSKLKPMQRLYQKWIFCLY